MSCFEERRGRVDEQVRREEKINSNDLEHFHVTRSKVKKEGSTTAEFDVKLKGTV